MGPSSGVTSTYFALAHRLNYNNKKLHYNKHFHESYSSWMAHPKFVVHPTYLQPSTNSTSNYKSCTVSIKCSLLIFNLHLAVTLTLPKNKITCGKQMIKKN